MALQASPTKSGTENTAAASAASVRDFTSKCLRGRGGGAKVRNTVSALTRKCAFFKNPEQSEITLLRRGPASPRTHTSVRLPVVGELQLQPGVVGRLDGDDVGEEVGPQQEADGLDDVGPLRLVPGQRQHGELLVGSQHHHLRSKHHPADKTPSAPVQLHLTPPTAAPTWLSSPCSRRPARRRCGAP